MFALTATELKMSSGHGGIDGQMWEGRVRASR